MFFRNIPSSSSSKASFLQKLRLRVHHGRAATILTGSLRGFPETSQKPDPICARLRLHLIATIRNTTSDRLSASDSGSAVSNHRTPPARAPRAAPTHYKTSRSPRTRRQTRDASSPPAASSSVPPRWKHPDKPDRQPLHPPAPSSPKTRRIPRAPVKRRRRHISPECPAPSPPDNAAHVIFIAMYAARFPPQLEAVHPARLIALRRLLMDDATLPVPVIHCTSPEAAVGAAVPQAVPMLDRARQHVRDRLDPPGADATGTPPGSPQERRCRKSSSSRNGSNSDVEPNPNARRRFAESVRASAWISVTRLTGRIDAYIRHL